MGPLQQALVSILMRNKDPWAAIVDNFTVDQAILAHTPVVLVSRGGSGQVLTRQVVVSDPPFRAWGVIPRCIKQNCAGNTNVCSVRVVTKDSGDQNHYLCRFTCNECHWRSKWVERPAWVNAIPHRPRFFWYAFPLSEEQLVTARGHDEAADSEPQFQRRQQERVPETDSDSPGASNNMERRRTAVNRKALRKAAKERRRAQPADSGGPLTARQRRMVDAHTRKRSLA
jgi:hypothetical protein